MSLNKVMLIGNVGKDPEILYLDGPDHAKVASFSLATSEWYKDRNGNPRETTSWHKVVCWRGQAEWVEKHVRKGALMYVEGKLRYSSWEDRNGNRRYTTEICAEHAELLGPRLSGQEEARPVQETVKPQLPDKDDVEVDDLPF